ncbi:MAG: outer membrane protein assembly factor BamA [Parachlamydiaceae bacterium]|nr:outer membrane protein assembly factor BamA [Parachlamydiaceae bacterium]
MLQKTSYTLFFLSLIFIQFATPCSFLHSEIVECENQEIERIEIITNASATCDIAPILARMQCQEGSPFSQTDFDSDLKRLAGDFDRIDPKVECINGKVYITLTIYPKPFIRSIQWIGNCAVKTSKLESELEICPPAVFDRRAFNQAFHKLKIYYVNKGYFEAQLNYDVIVDNACNEVDIVVTISEGRAGRVRRIEFVNFTCEEEEALRDILLTKRYNLFLSWMTDEGTYREQMIQQDEHEVLTYLQDRGYADARVTVAVTEARQCNRINITITADRGEKYLIGGIALEGNTLFCDEEVRKRYLIRTGCPYSPKLIRETIDRITTLYGKNGYIDALIDYEPVLCEDGCTYNIKFMISEGKPYRVGLIKVFGNCWTQTNVILHETLLVPGETFNLEKLKRTEERLMNTQFFKCVNVYPVRSDGPCTLGDNFRDVNIEVEEASTGHFGAFMGFSTTEDLFGGFNVSEDNFNSAGIPRVWCSGLRALRGGGEYAHFTATIGMRARSYLLSWSKPFFMDTRWTVGFDLERASNRVISKDYDINTTSFTLKGLRPINQFVRWGVHYRITNADVDITAHEHHREERDEAILADPDASSGRRSKAKKQLKGINRLEEEARHSGLLSAIGFNWIYDSTNHPVRPTRGWKSKAEFEYVGLGGAHRFMSFSYLNSFYQRFPDAQGVWKVRADLRFIQPLWGSSPGDVPINERYFLGGEYLIRGYRPFRPGPRYDDDDPRGGISLQYVSMEYSRFFIKRAEWFLFADAGYLSMHRWRLGVLQLAMGYGVKVYVFEGAPPLMMGMGYPVNPRDNSEVKRFFLTVGGRF